MTAAQTPAHFRAGSLPAQLDATAFERIANIAYREAGLYIAPAKAAMVHTRLARRLRLLGLRSYEDYCALIESEQGENERREMISALTTNVSHFFREPHHLDRLREEIIPKLKDRLDKGERIRIWSAGCSNGQEPYSIGTLLLDAGLDPSRADLRILATDIDPKVIAFARAGAYDERMISGLSEEFRDRYFEHDPAKAVWRACEKLKQLIAFRELNLLRPWPMKGRFDVIFCRNVLIYFDQKTQDELWPRFASAMRPGAWLFLGHSERVSDPFLDDLVPFGMTAYRRAPIPEDGRENQNTF